MHYKSSSVAWPKVEIIIHGDSHYNSPPVYEICNRHNIKFILGLTGYKALIKKVDDTAARLKNSICSIKVRSNPIQSITIKRRAGRQPNVSLPTLSTGQNYVLANIVSKGYRDLLTIAASRPGEKHFSKIWKIRNGYSEKLLAGAEWPFYIYLYLNFHLFLTLLIIIFVSSQRNCTILYREFLYEAYNFYQCLYFPHDLLGVIGSPILYQSGR
jgi:hypothetical protein